MIELSLEDFAKLLKDESIDCFVAMRLIKRVSSKQIVAYQNDVKAIDKEDKKRYEILEWYYRVRLLTDYISGMTDDFALKEFQVLSALQV